MCTPHGRHGSNDRTARMMSIPLKFSGPFSSKIGVFCTASSYGPGVPYTSRGARVPRRRRVRLVVRDLAFANHHVVREHAARGLVEAAADRALGNLEAVPALGPAGLNLLHRPLEVVQRDQRAVRLVVGPGTVTLDRVGLLRHVPLELHLGHVRRARQHHLDRVAGRLRVAEVDEARLGRAPLARERATAGVAADVRVGPLVVDPRGDHPRVLVGEVALLRPRQRDLVPRVVLVDRVAERVVCDERRLVLPAVEVRGAEQDPDHQVDLDEIGRDQLAADRHARRDVALATPLGHVPVVVVDVVRIVERSPVDEVRLAEARPCRSPAAPGRKKSYRSSCIGTLRLT